MPARTRPGGSWPPSMPENRAPQGVAGWKARRSAARRDQRERRQGRGLGGHRDLDVMPTRTATVHRDTFEDGAEVLISALRPQRRGRGAAGREGPIRVTRSEAILDGQFFMDTPPARTPSRSSSSSATGSNGPTATTSLEADGQLRRQGRPVLEARQGPRSVSRAGRVPGSTPAPCPPRPAKDPVQVTSKKGGPCPSITGRDPPP